MLGKKWIGLNSQPWFVWESRANKDDHNKMFAWEKKKEETNLKINSTKSG